MRRGPGSFINVVYRFNLRPNGRIFCNSQKHKKINFKLPHPFFRTCHRTSLWFNIDNLASR